jgi:hypothetical protein
MMKRGLWFAAALCVSGFSVPAHAEMVLKSESITEGQTLNDNQVYNGFGCTGKNLSPQLSWTGVPDGTKSLAITIYDPDAPTGSGWWHWLAYNIPVSTSALNEGASLTKMPEGTVEGLTDYGTPGFGGACPPVGDKPHHYIVTLFALDVDKLDVDAKATAAMIGFNLNTHMVEKVTLTGVYGR